MDKIFRPQEVDALIPRLEDIFQHTDVCQKRIHELGAVCPQVRASSSAAEIADSARIRSQMEFLLQAIQEDITLIDQLGGAVKDLGQGLVDFPGIVNGMDVWLCWKRGEIKVYFWHPLDTGFTDRRLLRRAGAPSTTTH